MGDDDFPEFYGYKPPALRSEIQEFTREDANLILYGDNYSDHGHHAFGQDYPGKTEFPEGWYENEVIEWVRAIIDHPSDAIPDPKGIGFVLFGEHHEVYGKVAINKDSEHSYLIATAHPVERSALH